MMGMGGLGEHLQNRRRLSFPRDLSGSGFSSPEQATEAEVSGAEADDTSGYGLGMGMYGMGGMGGMGYPYGMMGMNPYGYSGMVRPYVPVP